MFQVKEGKIVARNLPQSGRLSTGETVSGYHVLPAEILAKEGWLPVEEVKPLFDPAIEQLIIEKEEILKDKIKITYLKETIPAPLPDELTLLRAELEATKDILVEKKLITESEKDGLKVPKEPEVPKTVKRKKGK